MTTRSIISAAPRLCVRSLCLVTALSVSVAAQAPIEFEVVSLKRNTSGQLPIGVPPPAAATGQVRMLYVSLRTLIFQGYPVETLPIEVQNLPPWASDIYDFEAKGKPNASPDERRQMFRAMLADRLKLAAHYEDRERPGYALVVARDDKRLGPAIKPSSLDCGTGAPQPPLPVGGGAEAARAAALKRCGSFWADGDTITSGGVTLANLIRMVTPAAGRQIVDRTGLGGYFEITLRYQRLPARGTEPDPNAAPALFTALQEQLGLKLEPATTQGQILVLDHIERPTEN
jgi:uncharacterized protein (TIGR03435 family)